MNATCTNCGTVFRIDPGKVGAAGARARCSICRGIFAVAPPSGVAPVIAAAAGGSVAGFARAPVPPAVAPRQPTATAVAAQAVAPPTRPPAPRPAAAEPPQRPAAPAAPAAAVPAASAPVSTPVRPSAAPAGGRPNPFVNDPQAKARRLARALVSDIVTYHPERRERALQDGSLRREFQEEIRKSWEEYVEQVGAQVAQSTTYFRDALNDILAKGQRLF